MWSTCAGEWTAVETEYEAWPLMLFHWTYAHAHRVQSYTITLWWCRHLFLSFLFTVVFSCMVKSCTRFLSQTSVFFSPCVTSTNTQALTHSPFGLIPSLCKLGLEIQTLCSAVRANKPRKHTGCILHWVCAMNSVCHVKSARYVMLKQPSLMQTVTVTEPSGFDDATEGALRWELAFPALPKLVAPRSRPTGPSSGRLGLVKPGRRSRKQIAKAFWKMWVRWSGSWWLQMASFPPASCELINFNDVRAMAGPSASLGLRVL